MELTCIIMAGGKSSRFNFKEISSNTSEKSLLTLNSKPFIDYIIDAAEKSNYFSRIIVSTSPHTRNTARHLKSLGHASITIFESLGRGYIDDLHHIVKEFRLEMVIAISADIPLIKTELIDRIIENYLEQHIPIMSVMAPVDSFLKIGLNPTDVFDVPGFKERMVPIGIHLIDCYFIKKLEIPCYNYSISENDVIFNINTVQDYRLLQKQFSKLE